MRDYTQLTQEERYQIKVLLKVGHHQSKIATVLMQIKSSVMNRSLARLDITEAVSLGAAMLGGIGAGIFRDILEALEGLKYGQEEILPEPAWVETYQRQYAEVYQGAWEQLKPLQNKLLRLYPSGAAPS